MRRITELFFTSLVLFFLLTEPALANKFTTISGGVSGMSHEKIDFLKQISFYAGSFLAVLAILALITRNRFEGFVGYGSKGGDSGVIKGVSVLMVIGAVFILLGLV